METQENPTNVSRIGSKIDLKIAAKWTKYYRQRYPGETVSQLFGRNAYDNLLKQEDCQGIRIYYANSKPLTMTQRLVLIFINFLRDVSGIVGEKHVILVGTNSKGVDQIAIIQGKQKNPEGIQNDLSLKTESFAAFGDSNESSLYEQAMPCPGTEGCPSNELTY